MVIVVITDYRFPEGCAFVNRMHTSRFYIHYYLRINMFSNNLLYLIETGGSVMYVNEQCVRFWTLIKSVYC